MEKDFKIMSFNCEGIKRTCDYVRHVLNDTSCDILCLQEIWLLDSTIDYLNNIHKDYIYVGISGMDSNACIISGRPKGGVAILYKKTLGRNIAHIKSNNRRVSAIKF